MSSRDKLTFLYPDESHSRCSYHLTVAISHKSVGFSRLAIVPSFGEESIQELSARPIPELFLVGYLFKEQGKNKIVALQAMKLKYTFYFICMISWQHWMIVSRDSVSERFIALVFILIRRSRPVSRPPPCHYRDLFLVVPSSSPWSRFVNTQLVCLLQ